MYKKLGVIGGLGTDTAAQFYIEAERLWFKSGQLSHIPLMLENTQSPFSLEQSLTSSMERANELREYLCTAAKNLQKGGATFVALPCNTAHVHIVSLRKAVQVPVLSITEEVAKALQKRGVQQVAILGTLVTRSSGIYDKDCLEHGITTMYPSSSDQREIERIIRRALSWENDETDNDHLSRVVENMREIGADAVVLACTDLQLCMPILPEYVIDSMRTLVQASVKRLLMN